MKTTEAVVGNWPHVLPKLGIDSCYLTGKHTSCPICKNGKDKFRFDDKDGNGTFYCNDCGAGGGFKLLELMHGWDFKTSAKEIDRVIGTVSSRAIDTSDDTEKRRNRLNRLRSRVATYDKSDDVIDYLKNRGVDIGTISQITPCLGFVSEMDYWQDGKLMSKLPAMVAAITKSGKPISYHVTYLENGKKANVDTVRKILPPVRSITGGAVQLFKPTNILGIAEGIETAISACQLFRVPTWAAINANNLASFEIPEYLSELHIFGDNDESLTGQKAAYELGFRATRKGLNVHIHIPDVVNTDWNDVLNSGVGEAK